MTKRILVFAACMAVSLPACYAQETGVSQPELAEAASAKPSPATPVDAHAPVLIASAVPADDDNGIVTRVPVHPGELADGTIFRTRLDQDISTQFATPGSTFSARIVQPVMQDGRVIIPIGSSLRGRITKVSETRRIQGRAKLRLRPDEIVMPDGTHLMLHAQVIDTDILTNTRTDGEGTIVSKDNARKNWAITGAATGTGAVTGALVGGGVGAAVGSVIGAGVGAGHFIMSRQVASLPKSSTLVFQLTEPMSIAPLHD
jgi:hypothetical protein